MDFRLTEDQRLMEAAVRELASHYGLDYWREKDRSSQFIDEFWSDLGKGGWLGTTIATEFGGSGCGFLDAAIVIEAAAAAGGGATLGQFFMYTLLQAATLSRHGTEAQRQKYLPAMARGELACAIAVTEPNAGSNTLAATTMARRDGDRYILSGQKVFISGLERAQKMLVVARTTPAARAAKKTLGLSLFLVDVDAPGITLKPIEKVGTHCMGSYTVYLDEVEVAADDRIGPEDYGWGILVDTLNVERIITTAGSIAAGELAIRLAVDYANARVVFDRPIGANQGIQFPLAKAKAELAAARQLNYKAAWLFDAGEPCAAEGNMAKLIATDAAFSACDHAMQTLGGYGYATEFHIERLWRDVRLFKIAPVSQEMVLSFVAQHVLGLARS